MINPALIGSIVQRAVFRKRPAPAPAPVAGRGDETIRSVASWGHNTLGGCTVLGGLKKLAEEIGEVAGAAGLNFGDVEDIIDALEEGYYSTDENPETVGKELGDCAIVAITNPERMGYSSQALVNGAMTKNRPRTWNVDADGRAKHCS